MTNRTRWIFVWAGLLSATAMVGCGDDGGSGTGGTGASSTGGTGTGAGGSGTGATGTGATGTGGTGAMGGAGGSGGMGGTGGVVITPDITDVDPDSGIVTTTVTVTGTNFGATQGSSTVSIGGTVVTPTSWADDEILFDVPDTLFPGTADVMVNVNATDSNAVPFDVLLPRTVYTNNDAFPNTVSAFAMDAAGALTAVAGSPYATGEDTGSFGGDSSSVTVNRATRRLFATNDTSVAVFDIDPVTGALTAVAGSPFATGGTFAYGVRANAAGTRLFVANCGDNSIAVYNVAVDGVLTAVAGSPFAGLSGDCLDTPQIVAGEGFLAVTDELSALSVFAIDAATGALTEIGGSPFALGGYTFGSRMDPSGTYLYVPDTDNKTLQVFTFDAVTGVPTEIGGSPVAVATTDFNNGLAFTPDGARVYHGVFGEPELHAFDVAAGLPTALGASPFTIAGVSGTTSMSVSRDGAFLATAHEGDQVINVFSLAADGTPTAVAGSPFASDDVNSDISGLVIAE